VLGASGTRFDLAAAILCEICHTIALKLSDGLTRPLPADVVFTSCGAVFVILWLAPIIIGVGGLHLAGRGS
jgi:multidrug transporter EmrE-like cation transporter